jgi:hypothetical protein
MRSGFKLFLISTHTLSFPTKPLMNPYDEKAFPFIFHLKNSYCPESNVWTKSSAP